MQRETSALKLSCNTWEVFSVCNGDNSKSEGGENTHKAEKKSGGWGSQGSLVSVAVLRFP